MYNFVCRLILSQFFFMYCPRFSINNYISDATSLKALRKESLGMSVYSLAHLCPFHSIYTQFLHIYTFHSLRFIPGGKIPWKYFAGKVIVKFCFDDIILEMSAAACCWHNLSPFFESHFQKVPIWRRNNR